MKKNRTLDIRLIVGTEGGPKSCSWHIWTNKSDVYVVFSNQGHVEKLSFHSERNGSYACRKAFTSERGIPLGLTDRCTTEWKRSESPPSGTAGATCVFEIAFPTNFLSTATSNTHRSLIWLAAAPTNMATVLEMSFTREPRHEVVRLVGQERIVAYAALPSNEAFLITRRDAEFVGEEFVIPSSHDEVDDIIFTIDDPDLTGRPIRFVTNTTPKNGDRMTAWEYGGYRGRLTQALIDRGLGRFSRKRILDSSKRAT